MLTWVNAQIGKWKHTCRISGTIANSCLCQRRLSCFPTTCSNVKISKNITHPRTDINFPSWKLPRRLLFDFCFVTFTSSSTVMLLTPPSTARTSTVYPLQPLDWNTFNSLFLLFFGEFSKNSLQMKMETRLPPEKEASDGSSLCVRQKLKLSCDEFSGNTGRKPPRDSNQAGRATWKRRCPFVNIALSTSSRKLIPPE